MLTGPAGSPRWERPTLLMLLAATAVLYLWNLGASGWANAYYSAAAQAGSQSWKALFFASSDAANSITVDKPPVSLWVMGLSARIFGVSSWSILVPQALMGVAAVGVLYASVRRTFGPAAALIAGTVLATTPVATLMFRFNNPDALLVLLLVVAAYAVVRAQEKASTRWLVAAGALVGFAFLTKMLQALLVVPAFGLVYLIAAPTTLWRRVRQLAAALAALVASAGWYIALVELVPASARPYIGGSQNNSILELTLGYNGLGRITGNEVGSVGGGGQAGGWGRNRLAPDVQRRQRRPDLLAAARRPAPAPRRLLGHPPRTPHRPRQSRLHPLGRLAAGHRHRLQPHAGHLPRLLRRRPGARDRGDRRSRHRGSLADEPRHCHSARRRRHVSSRPGPAPRPTDCPASSPTRRLEHRPSWHGFCSRQPAPEPLSGRTSCSTAPPTGTPGYAP